MKNSDVGGVKFVAVFRRYFRDPFVAAIRKNPLRGTFEAIGFFVVFCTIVCCWIYGPVGMMLAVVFAIPMGVVMNCFLNLMNDWDVE